MIIDKKLKNKKLYVVFTPTEYDDIELYNGHNRKKAFKIAKNQEYTTMIEVFNYQLEEYPDFSRYEQNERIEYYEVTDRAVTSLL
jgi:hypothetical protein